MQDHTPRTTHLCTLLNGFFTRATLCQLLLGYIDQVTTILLHELGGHPKEATSKVHSDGTSRLRSHLRPLRRHMFTLVAQVNSGRTFAHSGGISQLRWHKSTPVAPSPAPCGTSRLLQSYLKVRFARHKVDFGFQVTF